MSRPLAAVVLAAGAGKRFHSAMPKVLHEAAGLPLVQHVLRAVGGLKGVERLLVVVGNRAGEVSESVKSVAPSAELIQQPELLGTGDAVRRCAEALEGFDGIVLVLSGDSPLITTETLELLVAAHLEGDSPITLLTARPADPTGYGRILRDEEGRCVGIVEQPDATDDQKGVDEVSSGFWCFERKPLFEALERTDNRNAQREYYLPQAAMLIAEGYGAIATVPAPDAEEIEGVNDRLQLAAASRVLWRRKVEHLARSGVGIEDPATTYIDVDSQIEPGTVVRPLTFVEGMTRIGSGCSIGPSTRIVDTVVEDGAEVTFSVVKESHIGASATVGPFAYLRPGTRLGPGAKAGSFVEIKGSIIGQGSKVPHLSYVGDAEVGSGVNLGAGTITANYDSESKVKSKTVIGDDAFTGSDTTLIAPVKLGRRSGTGAGAVVTRDVSEGQIVAGVPARPLRERKQLGDPAKPLSERKQEEK
jgi:bifunctional UDP-N-acetylglucosamine pyrophosphorylase/glucosamine-1-phosphate N-acetyltransferase